EVQFELNLRVTDLILREEAGKKRVDRILYERRDASDEIKVNNADYVIVTLGSMTEASRLGSMDSAPVLGGKTYGGAWTLWEKIAAGNPEFGRPRTFTDRVEQSKWLSFTATLHDPSFFRLVGDFTSNIP